MMMLWLSYPTSLIQQLRDDTDNDEFKNRIDYWSFWAFILGIWKDERTVIDANGVETKPYKYFYHYTFIGLLVGILFEKFSIAWLKNRHGCTHYRLQKFIELDMRREALRKPQWDVCLPAYDFTRYKKHYFLNDFDKLMYKIMGKRKDEEGNFYVQQD